MTISVQIGDPDVEAGGELGLTGKLDRLERIATIQEYGVCERRRFDLGQHVDRLSEDLLKRQLGIVREPLNAST